MNGGSFRLQEDRVEEMCIEIQCIEGAMSAFIIVNLSIGFNLDPCGSLAFSSLGTHNLSNI